MPTGIDPRHCHIDTCKFTMQCRRPISSMCWYCAFCHVLVVSWLAPYNSTTWQHKWKMTKRFWCVYLQIWFPAWIAVEIMHDAIRKVKQHHNATLESVAMFHHERKWVCCKALSSESCHILMCSQHDACACTCVCTYWPSAALAFSYSSPSETASHCRGLRA